MISTNVIALFVEKISVETMAEPPATIVTAFLRDQSNLSWKDAIVQAVAEASKTIDYLSNVKIIEQRARIDGKKLVEYFVDLDLSFVIDRDRD